jgi:hypothetical protein
LSRTVLLCALLPSCSNTPVSPYEHNFLFLLPSLFWPPIVHFLKGVNAPFYMSTRMLQYCNGFRRGLTSNCHFLEKFFHMVNSSV